MDEMEAGMNAMAAPVWQRRVWLGAATLASVAEVNDQVLDLMCAQCLLTTRPQAWHPDIGHRLLSLDAASRQRLAAGSVLLVDAGFADATLWPAALTNSHGVHDRDWRVPEPFFTVDGTVTLMRLVLTQAWHLAQSQPAAARLLLGLSPANLVLIGDCTLNRLLRLAEAHTPWLRPRWEHRPAIWRDLLQMGAQADRGVVERMRVRGLQLLAADARQG